jgi:hypothetical protein
MQVDAKFTFPCVDICFNYLCIKICYNNKDIVEYLFDETLEYTMIFIL